MQQSTLEAISITALVISLIILVVLVFMMIKGLFTNGGIVKMKGGNSVQYLNFLKSGIHNIPVAYSPGSDSYNDAIINFAANNNMIMLLYAIFSVLLIEQRSPEERAVANSLFDICRNNLGTNDDNSLISRTIRMLEAQHSGPIPLRAVYALDDEWLDYLRLPRDASARTVQLE